jgi:hypothetical protein
VGKLEGKGSLGRPKHRWKGGITMELGKIDYGGVSWIKLAQNRGRCRNAVNTVMKLRFPGNDPCGFIRGGEFLDKMRDC